MLKLCKVLLIWLCALAFPLQGMAAVVMLSCGGSHPQNMVTVHQAEHAHDAHEGHHEMASHAPTQSQADHGHSADKCSACASCCIGVGMAATLLQWQGESQGPSNWVASARMLLASFMADGLDRPPRPSLA